MVKCETITPFYSSSEELLIGYSFLLILAQNMATLIVENNGYSSSPHLIGFPPQSTALIGMFCNGWQPEIQSTPTRLKPTSVLALIYTWQIIQNKMKEFLKLWFHVTVATRAFLTSHTNHKSLKCNSNISLFSVIWCYFPILAVAEYYSK